ncbi:RNA polymerase sigma factor [Corynebacterium diphtheriae]|nr:RNA polymerase sigma factor [Corynebacterium diphtheriae]
MVGGIADPCVGIVDHDNYSDDQLVTLYLDRRWPSVSRDHTPPL